MTMNPYLATLVVLAVLVTSACGPKSEGEPSTAARPAEPTTTVSDAPPVVAAPAARKPTESEEEKLAREWARAKAEAESRRLENRRKRATADPSEIVGMLFKPHPERLDCKQLGRKIDPEALRSCQLDGYDLCLDALPDDQFACDTKADCETDVPDGKCCINGQNVAYNRAFSKQLYEHRPFDKPVGPCAKFKCPVMRETIGWYHADCRRGKCALDPDWKDDDLGPLDL